MIEQGMIPKEECYIDAYNKTTNKDIASCISARVDDGNHLVQVIDKLEYV